MDLLDGDERGHAPCTSAAKIPACPPNPAPADRAPRVTQCDYLQAFRQAGVGILMADFDGVFIEANPAICRLLGYADGELVGRTISSISHPGDLPDAAHRMRGYLAGEGLGTNLTKRYLHKSGRVIWVALNVTLIRDADGNPRHFVTHVQDVTERQHMQWLEEDRRRVLEMIAQDHPLDAVLHQIVRMIERQTPRVWPCVMMLQDGTLLPFAPSLPPELREAIARRPVTFASRLSQTPVPESANNPAPRARFADVASDFAWEGLREVARAVGVRSAWAVTLHARDLAPLGILMACSPDADAPTSDEDSLLATAASLLTLAMEHHQTTRQLAHLVRHDALTGLPNRILFEDRLQQALSGARRGGKSVALLALDLNRFKQVNDTLGHHAGDSLLQQFAHRLRARLRDTDTLARVGGDEFMLILPEIAGPDEPQRVARRLREALAASPFEVCGHALMVDTSIGIALFPADAQDPAALQRAADAAMYRAKADSRAKE